MGSLKDNMMLFALIFFFQGYNCLTLNKNIDINSVNPCKNAEPGYISCVHVDINVKDLIKDQILPNGQHLSLTRNFKHNQNTNVYLYEDKVGNEMMIVERHERIMARATMKNDDIFFIEPCNNWEGCHVWKHYIAKDIFRQETDVQDSENEVFDQDNKVKDLGEIDQDTIVEFSIKFYVTNQFMESTDDIDLFVETVVVDMNVGYENSNIPVRAKVHCIEPADIDDQASSSDTLHVFNDYKPSYAEIRGSADAAQLLANDFENCGSGYTYTVPKENGHTLTTAKKSCSYGYHSSLHEVGHNFGCHHDRDNGDNSYYDYGYGWLIGPEDLDGIGYRTVLAYSNPGYHRRVNQISNPDISYNGYPTGDAALADNARVIRDNRFLMQKIGDESESC